MRTVVLPDPEELQASFFDDPAAPSSAVESQDEAGQMDWSSFDEECVKPKNKLPMRLKLQMSMKRTCSLA